MSVSRWRVAGALIVFTIVGAGRFSHMTLILGHEIWLSALWACFYALFSSFAGFFVIDLIFASGHLRSRIYAILTTCIILFIPPFLNRVPGLSSVLTLIGTFVAGLIVALHGALRVLKHRNADFDIREGVVSLPAKYLRRRPVLTAFETILRLFPFPEAVALYRIGNPHSQSPVVVTGNYELTLRRVARATRGMNLWLLVCDSRGINIWCSSLAGHFGEKPLIAAIGSFEIADKVTHRTLILPQLCAGGVNLREVKKRTGFTCRFGPVEIADLESHLLRSPASEKALPSRRVRFPLNRRLEMAIGSPIIAVILLALIFNFFSPGRLLHILPSLYIVSVFHGLVFPYRPARNVKYWSLVFGAVIFGLCWLISQIRIFDFTDVVSLSIASVYLVNEFEGWSPLAKYSMFTIYRTPLIEISDSCIGCGACVEVCPKGVYRLSDGRARVVEPTECISCKSCLMQCPSNAILMGAQPSENA